MDNIFKISFGTFKAFFDKEVFEASLGERIIFSLILSLLSDNKALTKTEVVKHSRAKDMTTYLQLRKLEQRGLIRSWKESNQFYSPMFIELTEKGLSTASRLRRAILS